MPCGPKDEKGLVLDYRLVSCLFSTEPTTDKFTLVLHGAEDGTVEGTSLSVIKELPYEGLKRFGPG